MKPAVAHSNVLLFFSNLDIADPNDRLSIYDGDAVDATKLLASYTGSTIPPSVRPARGHRATAWARARVSVPGLTLTPTQPQPQPQPQPKPKPEPPTLSPEP